MNLLERVRMLPTTNKPMTRWRWANCKCGQCGAFHVDLVPHHEKVHKAGKTTAYCRVECDRCLYARVPVAAYDMYVNMRQALADQLGLKRE